MSRTKKSAPAPRSPKKTAPSPGQLTEATLALRDAQQAQSRLDRVLRDWPLEYRRAWRVFCGGRRAEVFMTMAGEPPLTAKEDDIVERLKLLWKHIEES